MDANIQKNKVEPYLMPYIKINLKQMEGTNVISKTIGLLKENERQAP